MNPDSVKENNSFLNKLALLTKKFSPAEKMFFGIFSFILIISSLSLLIHANNLFTVEVPGSGGALREGMLGSPRFINPLLALGDSDKSISELVYSGLFKSTPEGIYIPDLADSFSVSSDGIVYDIKIKQNAVFQDGKPVTADDVVFTITKAIDPVIKSPKAASWDGVLVEKVNDKEVKFTLKKPYSSFFENLTLGILPEHVWQNITSEEFPFSNKNLDAIGSGPYQMVNVSKDSGGVPQEVVLKPFKKYVGGQAKIGEIDFSFYQDEQTLVSAFKSKSIDAMGGITPSDTASLGEAGAKIYTSRMPRIFAAFFNQNQAPLFANIEIRKALDISLDKKELVKEIIGNYGAPISGPTPVDSWQAPIEVGTSTPIDDAKALLAKNGWKLNKDNLLEKKTKSGTQVLKFSISTADVPDLKKTAEILAKTWTDIGASVDVKVFELGDLNNNVIKPRKYDILLFGEVVGKDMDLYPFWHSSERNDPGLNISLYANITADKLLEDIRSATDTKTKEDDTASLKQEIEGDVGAVFLYTPEYIYAVSPNVKNVSLPKLTDSSDRFGSINDWYIKTDKVWQIFANK